MLRLVKPWSDSVLSYLVRVINTFFYRAEIQLCSQIIQKIC